MKIFLKHAQETANICWAISTINVLFECVLLLHTCCIYMLFFQIKKKILFAQHCLLPTILSLHYTEELFPGLHRFLQLTVMLLKTNAIQTP